MITMASSDGEIHLKEEWNQACEPCSLLIPAARMLVILRELDGETLTLTASPGKLRLQCGSSDYKVTLDGSDFPPVPSFDADQYFSVDAKRLADAITKTAFSTDEKSTRYSLGGIQCEFDSVLTLASTDSKRLSAVQLPFEKINGAASAKAVIPAVAMRMVKDIPCDGNTLVAIRANDVTFKIATLSVTCQQVQGMFPNWRKVIPGDEAKRRTSIPVNQFANLVKRVRAMETGESNAIDLSFGEGKLVAASIEKDIGSAVDEIPIPDDGEKMTIRMSAPYISEVLKVLDASTSVEVRLMSKEDRVLFVSDNYQHVIMSIQAVD
jgi:DNA polymerase-3 subunit beta